MSAAVVGLIPARRGPRAQRVKQPGWVEQVVIAVRLYMYWSAMRGDLSDREDGALGRSAHVRGTHSRVPAKKRGHAHPASIEVEVDERKVHVR